MTGSGGTRADDAASTEPRTSCGPRATATPHATTRVCLIVGHPVAQVRSPAVLNRRFAALGLDAAMVPADIEASELDAFWRTLRAWRNLAGCVVTVPHKQAAAERVDRLSDRARRLGAVNVVRRDDDGTLSGDLLDGVGFLTAAAAHGFAATGRRAIVFGAGGAGSAIADALCEHGIGELVVHDVARDRADALRRLLQARHPAVALGSHADGRLHRFDLVVNASTVGMDGTDAMPVDAAAIGTLRSATLVADVVTRPVHTPLLVAAGGRGCQVQTGVEMADAQADALGRFMGVLP